MEGMRMGVKVEKPDTYDGDKSRDLDTWLFQVCEHLNLTVIPRKRPRSIRSIFAVRQRSALVA